MITVFYPLCYDEEKDEWEAVADMSTARFGAGVAASRFVNVVDLPHTGDFAASSLDD